MTPKRQAVEAHILKTLKIIDPSLYNVKVYQDFFAGLSDGDFDLWMLALRDSKHTKIKLLVPPLKVVISPENAFKAAKFLGIEVLERLRLWDPVGKRYCLTPEKYYILKLPVRRLRQYLMDGLSVPDDDKRLNPLTDQVTGPSKGSAISFPQAQMIAEKGLEKTLHELMTIRGGDLDAWSKMKAEIEEQGDAHTSVSEGTSGIKSAQTLRSFFNAMHLTTNI